MRSPAPLFLSRLLALVCAATLSATALAAEDTPLAGDPALSVTAVLDAALARDPAAAIVDARSAEAGVLASRARSWLADDAAVGLRGQDSGPLGRSGIRETEGGLDLPIWRPGQRGAARDVADGSRAQRDAEARSRTLRVAGEVREAIWDVAVAQARVAQAREALAAAQTLEAAVDRRVALGDAAAADRLPARDWRLDREARLQEAEVVRIHAELAYRLLTGLDRVPAQADEADDHRVADAEAAASGEDPWLAADAAQLARARAEAALARSSRGGNPVLMLGARRELGGPDNTDINSLGVGVRVPLGIGAASRAPEAAAAIAVAEAESALKRAERRQIYLRHEAEHEREAALRARDRLQERAGIAERELVNAAKGWAAGELDFADRLRVETRAREVLGDAAVADLEYRRAVARHHQILGVLP